MQTDFKESFKRDLKKTKEADLRKNIVNAIEKVEQAKSLSEVRSLKKLRGNRYRIRIGNYRIGLTVEGGTVVFVRVLHRKELYRYF